MRSSHDWLWENCGLVSPSKFRRRDTDEDTPPQLDFLLGGTAAGVGPIHEEEMPRSRSREPESRAPMKSSGYSGGAFDRAMASSGRAWGDRGPATEAPGVRHLVP